MFPVIRFASRIKTNGHLLHQIIVSATVPKYTARSIFQISSKRRQWCDCRSKSELLSSCCKFHRTLHESHKASIAVQQRRNITLSGCYWNDENVGEKLEKLDPKKFIAYTCKVCNTRNTHTFSKKAYEDGIVIVTCEGCKSRHLIADNLGWFQHVNKRNIEEILAEKSEQVRYTTEDGSVEVFLNADSDSSG